MNRMLTLQLFLAAISGATLVLVLASRSRSHLIDRLRDKEATLDAAIEGAVVGIFTMELTGAQAGVITGVNPAFREMTGFSGAELIGAKPSLFTDMTDEAEVRRMTDSLRALGEGAITSVRRDKRLIRADGSSMWVELSISPVHLTTGERFALVHVQDLSERKEREDRLERLAMHDPLTGLPNRALLADRLDFALRQRARSGRATGVIYVDLDGFKQINDVYGHAAGDTLLKVVAGRLQDNVRPGDTVGRIGGDEFVVCCPDLPEDAATETLDLIAARLRQTFAMPLALSATREVKVGASIGAAVSETASTVEQLLHDSDQLMYAHKKKRAGARTLPRPRTVVDMESSASV